MQHEACEKLKKIVFAAAQRLKVHRMQPEITAPCTVASTIYLFSSLVSFGFHFFFVAVDGVFIWITFKFTSCHCFAIVCSERMKY